MRGTFALIIHNHKLLMLLRDNNPNISNPNCWSLIGGGIEEGESSEEALIRESFEEANLILRREQLKFLTTINNDFRDLYVVYITDEQAKSVKLGNEGQAVSFWSLAEIERLELGRMMRTQFEKNREFLKKLLEA